MVPVAVGVVVAVIVPVGVAVTVGRGVVVGVATVVVGVMVAVRGSVAVGVMMGVAVICVPGSPPSTGVQAAVAVSRPSPATSQSMANKRLNMIFLLGFR